MSDPSIRPSPVPSGPAADDPAKAGVYRPISILAVVGAGLGGLYAVVVVLGGLAAFFRGDPWLLPGWSALFPVTAAGLSVLGLVQIQRSEGTLAGEKVARWGLLLSALFGLKYWAYVGATYFAIGQEADRFGRSYMDKLARGESLSAFRLTLAPAERPPEDAQLRAQLEGRFNSVTDAMRKGTLATFAQSDLVRLLGQGGPETKIEPLGVEDWKYTGGGYQVQMLYRVSTPHMATEVTLGLQGKEGKGSEGRLWHVLTGQSGVKSTPPPEVTDEGKKLYELAMKSRDYANREWGRALHEGKTEEVYLGTLPASQRERVRASAEVARVGLLLADGFGPGALPCAAPAVALAREALAVDDDRGRAVSLPGLDAFLAGGLVSAEKDVFWAPEETREEIIRLAREAFRQTNDRLAQTLMPEPSVRFPLVRPDGDRFVVEQDVTLRVPPAAPRFIIDARLVTDYEDPQAARTSAKAWRVRGLTLVSGKTLPPQPPGAPGMPLR